VAKPQQVVDNSSGLLADVVLMGQLAERMLLMACKEDRLLGNHASRGRVAQLLTLSRLLAMNAQGDSLVPLSVLRRAVRLPKNTVHAQLRDAIEREWVICCDGSYSLTKEGVKIASAVAKAVVRAEKELAPMITRKHDGRFAMLGQAFLAAPESIFSGGFVDEAWRRFRDANTRRVKL
jgi:hypothetical protein